MSLTDIFDLAKSMGAILGLAFFVAIVIWTYKDARKRTDDPIMVATFTAISMLPLFGVLIYMLVRPSEYMADVRERELEIRALERQLGRQERCPYCKSHIEGDYLSCPVCTTKLRQSCSGCDKPLDPRWVMCPFCETEVPGKGGGRGPAGPGGVASTRRPSTPVNTSAREPRARRADRDSSRDRTDRSERTSSKRDASTTVVTSAVRSSDDEPVTETKPKGDDIRTEPFSS
ncbi:MAG: hypothetical protein JWL76_431 [Thermoleophilia bacterium]|nr:hypothetical protein [Thermoleophilia bacterium]